MAAKLTPDEKALIVKTYRESASVKSRWKPCVRETHRLLGGRFGYGTIQHHVKGVEFDVPPEPAVPDPIKEDVDRRRAKAADRQLDDQYRTAIERIDALEQQLSIMGQFAEPNWSSVPAIAEEPSGDAAAVIPWCDWHAEERVEPDTVAGLNEYNLDIFAARHRKMLNKTLLAIKAARVISNIDEVVIALLGDFFSGYIHEELQVSNALGPAEAVHLVRDKIVEGIQFIRANVPDIARFRVVACYGNHSRITAKVRHGTAYKTSLEYLIYADLAQRYANHETPLPWEIAKGAYAIVNIKDHRVRFHHGDKIRYQGGIGGISIPLNKAIGQWNKGTPADLDVLGHWHQYKVDRGSRFITCPCLIGHTPFAIDIKADFEEPAQVLFVVDRNSRFPVLTMDLHCGEKRTSHAE